MRACDIIYIATDVPTDGRGQSDLSGISRLIEEVNCRGLGPNALLCVLCQVPPGFTRGLRVEPERLYYQVETLVFGRAVERAPARAVHRRLQPSDATVAAGLCSAARRLRVSDPADAL